MMKAENLEKMLYRFSQETAQLPGEELAADIKRQIPRNLTPHKGGLDTIKIIIDLRINKLTAAAAIIITMVLCVNFFNGRDSSDRGIYQDGRMVVKYLLGDAETGGDKVSTLYKYLVHQGKKVTLYGDGATAESETLLMHWQISEGEYRVIFGDLSAKTISAAELIKLQGAMLQKK